jgi:hypothetical protein
VKRIAIGIGAIFVLFAVGFYLIPLRNFLNVECSHDILLESKSPDRGKTLTVEERNCGATTPFVTYVGIRNAGDKYDPGNYRNVVMKIRSRRARIDAVWLNNKCIVIECRECRKDDIEVKKKELYGIEIRYGVFIKRNIRGKSDKAPPTNN